MDWIFVSGFFLCKVSGFLFISQVYLFPTGFFNGTLHMYIAFYLDRWGSRDETLRRGVLSRMWQNGCSQSIMLSVSTGGAMAKTLGSGRCSDSSTPTRAGENTDTRCT